MTTTKSTKSTSKTLDDILAKATPVERTVYVCVAGALAGEYEDLRNQLEASQNDMMQQARLSGQEHSKHLLAEMDRVQAEMAEATFPFRFKAVSPKKWSDLAAANADPATGGINMQTFTVAVIGACCVEPEGLSDPEQLDRLLENLSPAQQSELFDAAWEVNNTAPKGQTYSAASVTQ